MQAVTVPSQPLSHWKRKEMEGLNQAVMFCLEVFLALSIFGFMQIFRAVMSYMYTSIQTDLELFLCYFQPNGFMIGPCIYKDNSSNNNNNEL